MIGRRCTGSSVKWHWARPEERKWADRGKSTQQRKLWARGLEVGKRCVLGTQSSIVSEGKGARVRSERPGHPRLMVMNRNFRLCPDWSRKSMKMVKAHPGFPLLMIGLVTEGWRDSGKPGRKEGGQGYFKDYLQSGMWSDEHNPWHMQVLRGCR